MSIDERMDFPAMEAMAKAFSQAQSQLNRTMEQVLEIASKMENGALVGDGGVAFVEAIRSQLSPKLVRLQDKMGEMAGDIKKNMETKRSTESHVATHFN